MLPANNNLIVVNNAGIKAWQAQTVNMRLEHYFEGVGQFSIGAFRREKYNSRINWDYRGRQRNAPVTGVGIEPGTFNYSSKRLYIDVLGEYYFWKRVGLFVNLRNVGDATETTEIYGPSTPEHAQFRQRIDYASLSTIGIKGTF